MIRALRHLLPAATALALIPSNIAHATAPPLHGPLPPEVRQAFAAGGFRLAPERPQGGRARSLPAGSLAAPSHSVWRVPVVLVSYADSALRYDSTAFVRNLFDTTGTSPTGSIYDYYQWVSHGRVRVIPTIIGVVTVPQTRAFYAGNFWGLNRQSTPQNDYGLVRDALNRTNVRIDWSVFDQDHDNTVDMLWVVHAGIGGEADSSAKEPGGDVNRTDLWSITSHMSNYWLNGAPWNTPTLIPGSNDVYYQVERFSILPELSAFGDHSRISEIGVYCHEFGHALGLPDLYDTSSNGYPNAGPGFWSLMAFGVYGGNGRSPEYPTRPGAWCEQYLGWTQPLRPDRDTTLTLSPAEQNGPVLDLLFQGQPTFDHFLVENRHRESFDRNLPADGLLVWHADESAIALRLEANLVNAGFTPGLVIVEADGNKGLQLGWDRADTSDTFPGGASRTYLYDVGPEPSCRTFAGSITNLGLFDIRGTGTTGDVTFDAQVRAPGWQPEVDRTSGTYDPVGTSGSGNRGVLDASGNLHVAGIELRSGHAQAILRERLGDVWQPPVEVSQTTGEASDVTITALPGGDVALAWADTRGGSSQIYYRARIAGAWMPEAPLASLAGENYGPAIGSDGRGVVQVAWLNVAAGVPSVRLMAFAYPSPFGRVQIATRSSERPDLPALAVGSGGSSVVVWTDLSTTPARLRFAHFHPDSGMAPALALTDPTGKVPQFIQAAIDSSGTLYTSWIMSGPGTSEIHYQRRPRNLTPYPSDTTIAQASGVIESARLALDPGGGVHLAYQGTFSSVSQIFYKRWLADRGWDTWATEITPANDGSAVDPIPAAAAPGRLTMVYSRFVSGQGRMIERRRTLDTPVQLAVPPPGTRVDAMSARAWPNPLRAGRELTVAFGARAGDEGTLEVLDLAGRCVGRATLARPDARVARFGPAVTSRWGPGVYFLRLSGHGTPVARVAVLR